MFKKIPLIASAFLLIVSFSSISHAKNDTEDLFQDAMELTINIKQNDKVITSNQHQGHVDDKFMINMQEIKGTEYVIQYISEIKQINQDKTKAVISIKGNLINNKSQDPMKSRFFDYEKVYLKFDEEKDVYSTGPINEDAEYTISVKLEKF